MMPKWFRFFTGLCLVLGVVGLLGNSVFLFMNISHGMSLKVGGGMLLFWLAALHLIRSAGYLAGWALARSRSDWASALIVTCAATSLAELVYNTASSVTKGVLHPAPATVVYFIVPLILEGSLLCYFSRREVRAFMANRPD